MDSLMKIGFVGLGKMGTPMAINIQKTGYPMVVYDAREEAAIPMLEGGAKLADSPAATAELSDIVMTCLPRPQVVEEVVTGSGGILDGIRQGSVYIDMSTCSPPINSSLGFHLLWVEGVKKGGRPNLNDHWPDIEALALNKKKMDWYDEWITSAKENFYVEILGD